MPGLITSKPTIPQWTPRPSAFTSLCHPLVKEVTEQHDAWFLKNWPFPSSKASEKFVNAKFGLLTSVWFPLSKDERLLPVSKLISILFLIDGKYCNVR